MILISYVIGTKTQALKQQAMSQISHVSIPRLLER